MGIKIDLGCGPNKRPSYIGIDVEPFGQEIIRDIRRGLPFSDGIVSEVNMEHFLEHIPPGEDLFFLISEIYRVCHNGALIHIRVPKIEYPLAFMGTHRSFWNKDCFIIFSKNLYPHKCNIPECYNWNFSINKLEENNAEIVAELTVVKHEVHAGTKKTSIIIVSYKNIDDTERCIKSIIRWTKDIPYEIVVVNNSQEEKAIKLLNNFSEEYSHIKVFHSKENLGWIGGINKGYELINPESEFVIFANNDTVITENGWLSRLLSHFTEDTGAVGPVSNYIIGRQSIAFNHTGIWEEYTNTLIGFFMCIRKEIIDKIGLLDERFGEGGAEDHDYSIRIRKEGYQLKIARDVYIHHSGSKSFMPVLSPEGYNKFWKEKDNILMQKWGEDEVKKLFLPPLKVVIAIPEKTDYVHRLFTYRLCQMVKPWNFTIVDCPRVLIHDARNLLVKEAKRIEAHYILFLDDDMILPTDLFVRLFNHQAPIVSALAFKRRPPYEPCIYHWEFNKNNGMLGVRPAYELVKKGLKKVDATGFGAILINMEVFDKIKEPWFELRDYGEDIDFCLKCYDAGIPIYCDTDLIVQHIGDNELVDESNFEKSISDGKIPQGITVEIHEKDKVRRQLVSVL